MSNKKLYTVQLSTWIEMAVQASSELEARKIARDNIEEELGNQDHEWDVDSVSEGSPGPHWRDCLPYRADDDSLEKTCGELEGLTPEDP